MSDSATGSHQRIHRSTPDFLKKILIIRLGAFGDVVRTIPAVDALKAVYPESSITWLVDEGSANILQGADCLDSVIILPRKGILHDLSGAVSALMKIRHQKFTCVLDFHGLFRSGLFAFLSGCRHRVGFSKDHVREINHLFNNIYIDPGTDNISRYQKNHFLVELFDVPSKYTPPKISLMQGENEIIDEFIASLGGGQFVTVHPGTSYRGRYKRWYPERFAVISDFIVKKYNLSVILLFTEEEKIIVDEIISKSKEHLFLSPKINQRQLYYLISRSRLYIGLDSGSMHIASLSATPIVAIFGPSDVIHNKPADYAPYRIVYCEVDCAPCRNRSCRVRHCMDAVQTHDVIEAIQEMME